MIYLDNNATTFIDPVILERYHALLKEGLGNPHSMHRPGQHARHILVEAKRRIASWFQVPAHQVIITSGATEALSLAIHSTTGHIITSTLEHAAVREAVNQSRHPVTRLDPLPGKGSLDVKQLEEALRPDTKMIVITAANNETGICSNIEEIARWAYNQGLLLVIDAVAYIGKETWQVPVGNVAVIISGHKIHAPVGVGALIIFGRFPLKPLFAGGGQQRGIRGGTEMVALADALALALERLNPNDYVRMEKLRNQFEQNIKSLSPHIHGRHEKRVSNVSNVSFPGVDGETLLMKLDLESVAVSHGSACQSGALELSTVLLNMGIPREIVRGSLRFSLSRYTTEEQIDQVVTLLTRIILMPVNPASSASKVTSPIAI